MNITLQLSPEVGRRLEEVAAISGLTVEEYIRRLAEQSVSGAPPNPPLRAEEWVAQWRAWTASHQALPQPADDDRESINAGRGE